MSFFRRTPLAWKNLTHDRRRLAVAVAGIAFAVLLMFMETGFNNALLDSTVQVILDLDADIVLASKAKFALPSQQRFMRQRIYEARMCPEVTGAYPLYVENYFAMLKVPGHKGRPIRVLAYNPDDPIFPPDKAAAYREALRRPDTALIDIKSKSYYGIDTRQIQSGQVPTVELSGQEVELVGWFELGTDFANDGNLLLSARNFASYFPFGAGGDDPLSVVDLGLVQVRKGADVRAAKLGFDQMLPDDVAVYTRGELLGRELTYWSKGTSVGSVFGVGTAMGFVVGVIICYQIIYASIADHMREFATLKAMGYKNRYFIGVVILESLYLSLLGFIPGLLISLALYQELASSTGLLMILTVPRAVFVYALALAMCIASGCLAMWKVLSANPADLF